MNKNKTTTTILIETAVNFGLILATGLLLTAASAATVTTDQPDYPPGSTAQITGEGFQPGEIVELQVANITFLEDIGDEHLPWQVTADENGALSSSWYVTEDEAGMLLHLTGKGLSSGLFAEWFFTDAPGTPANLAQATTTTAGTNLNLTVPAGGVAAGNTLLISFAMDPVSGSVSVADSKGNSYTADADVMNGTSGSGTGVRTLIFSAPVQTPLAAGDLITITHPSATARAASAVYVSGLVTAAPADRTATATGRSTSPASGNTATTTVASELLFCATGVEETSGTATTFSAGSGGYTALTGSATASSTGISVFPEYRTVTTTGTYSGTGTLNQTRRWATALVTYKAGTVTTTTLASSGSPSTYGNPVTFTATVTPNTAAGTVDFFDGATLLGSSTLTGTGSKTAAYTTTASELAAGTHASITALYRGSATHTADASSALAQTVNPLTIQLTGSKVYDGTTIIAATDLSVANNIDGANLGLSGNAIAASKDVGNRAIEPYAGPARVQATTGSANNANTITMTTLGTTPANGNTLIAIISTRGTSQNQVSGITQTGAMWTRATQAANAANATVEIWYAANVTNASKAITINLASSLKAAAAVIEYSGILTTNALDAVAGNSGTSTSAATGTTPTTSQTNELWVAGIALANSGNNLSAILNSFTQSATTSSTGAGTDTSVYALERVATATGTASSGGTVNASTAWSGAIATFKAELATGTPLTLTGSAAGNYTLTGTTGTVSITAAPLTVTADDANRSYGSSNPTFNASYTGFVAGETATLVTGAAEFTTEATSLSAPGTYALAPSIGSLSAANYAFTTFVDGTLTIDKANLTLTLSSSANPAATYASLSFTVTATGDGSTPIGSVQLLTNGAACGAEVALSNGSATIAAPSDFRHGYTTVGAQFVEDANYHGTNATAFTQLVNRAPSANNKTLGTTQNQSATVTLTKWLNRMDVDADGDSITLAGVSSTSTNGGTVVVANGGMTYTPVTNFYGTDAFTYTITDGYTNRSVTVVVQVVSADAPSGNIVGLTPPDLSQGKPAKVRYLGVPGSTRYLQFRPINGGTWQTIATNVISANGLTEVEDHGSLSDLNGRAYRTANRP